MAEAMAKSRRPLYWPADGHCTDEGYHVIGEAIYKNLIKEGLTL